MLNLLVLSKDLEKPLNLKYENIFYEEYLNYQNFIKT
jgi:hypothetical protein